MNHPNCKTCPVQNCDTLHYRGSRCAALRDHYGLDDPDTKNAQVLAPRRCACEQPELCSGSWRVVGPLKNQKVLVIPLEDWEGFYKDLTSNLEPYDHYDTGYQDALDRVDDWLEILASKEAPTPATGSWEFVNDYQSRCTACGEISWIDHNAEHRFCPNCGTRMTLK